MTGTEKISNSRVRRINRNRVYRCLYGQQTPKTKRDIEQGLGISMPTVTQNLKELMAEGLIAYVGMQDSTGGRRPRQIGIVPAARFAVGLELSPECIRYVAVDLAAQEIAFQQFDQPFSNTPAYSAQLASQLEVFLDQSGLDRQRLLGIGITLPGIVDKDGKIVVAAPVLGVYQVSVSLLTGHIPYPCFVQNDATAGGFAENWFGNVSDSMAYLYLGKGVGGALMLEGKPFAGQSGRSAEFGHTCVQPDGAPCNCGKRGCLEAYCSTARLTDDLHLRTEQFFSELHAGGQRALQVWNRYLDYLALGIHNIRMSLDCDVLLGGVISPYLPDYLPDLYDRLDRLSPFHQPGGFLKIGVCGSKANCIGVALHFIQQFIEQV